MKKRQLLAIFAAFALMAATFAGCSDTDKNNENNGTNGDNTQNEQQDNQDNNTDGNNTGDNQTDDNQNNDVNKGDLNLTANFKDASGNALSNNKVSVIMSGVTEEYELKDGVLNVENFASEGMFTLAVQNENGEEIASGVITIEAGELTDATTDEEGNTTITLASDAKEVSLNINITEDGKLDCSLAS